MIRFPKPHPRRLDVRAIKATRAQQWRELRRRILARDRGICRICARVRATDCHHVIYRSLGGKDVAKNLIAVCPRCHYDIHGHVVRLRWSDDTNPQATLRIERAADERGTSWN